MKKITCIFLASLGFASLQAQITGQGLTPDERARNLELLLKNRQQLKESGIQTMKVEKQNFKKGQAKGEYFTVMVSQFDANGLVQARESFTKKGKSWRKTSFTYTPEQLLSSMKEVKPNGRPVYSTEQQFENSLLSVSTHRFGARLQKGSQQTFTYDPAGKVTQIANTRLQKPGAFSTWKYSYHEDGSKQRMEKYNHKGRLLSATDYTCDPAGKTIGAAHVEERQVCERTEHDASGRVILVTETFIGGHEKFRQISRTDEAGHLLEITVFNQAGGITYSQKNEFNERGRLTASEEYTEGGKLLNRTEWSYDERGNVAEQTRKNGEGDILYRSRYSYTYFN